MDPDTLAVRLRDARQRLAAGQPATLVMDVLAMSPPTGRAAALHGPIVRRRHRGRGAVALCDRRGPGHCGEIIAQTRQVERERAGEAEPRDTHSRGLIVGDRRSMTSLMS